MRFRLVMALVVASAAVLGLPAAALGFAAPTQFGPTGAEQSYAVPSGVLVEGVTVQGAWGGSTDPQPPASNGIFAAGASLQGYLATTPGQTLYAEVGQNGTAGGGPTFGGGGAAGAPPPGVPNCMLSGSDMNVPCDGPWAGSGGGASDVRTCSELGASCPGGGTSADSRLIVAAGGGGEGGGGLVGNGAGCDNASDRGGLGQNNQLPTGSSAGPAAITTAAGIVIPGFAGGDQSSVTTTDGSTNAAMGATAAGAGGGRTGCTVNTVSYAGSVAGGSGSGADGGAGGNASALGPCCGGQHSFAPGGGGGGGGGYFGGGGGATGMGTCSPSPCGNGGPGQGGGAGSSFVSDAIAYPTFTFAQAVGDVFIEFWPIIEIDTPANGAVYSAGQVVDASWECASYSSGPGGCNSSSGTVPSGSPIDTTPGTHTFTVNAKVNVTGNGSQPVSATVTYTVTSGSGATGGTGAASSTGGSSSGGSVSPGVGHVTLEGTRAHVPLTCAGSGSCRFDLTLSVTEKVKGGKVIAVTAGAKHSKTKKKVVVVGTLSRTLSGGQSAVVTVTLNGTGQRLLRKYRTLTTKLVVVSGTSTVATKTLTFVEHNKQKQ